MSHRAWPAAAVAALACPVCRGPLRVAQASPGTSAGGLACASGHRFDAARQGYVHLAAQPIRHPGDTAEMVAARERVQAAGLFHGLTAALAAAVPPWARVVLDVGAGTGHHLAGVLDARPDAAGIALDTAKPALRRAARAHPQVLAVAADATGPLPVRDRAVDAVLIAFAPRAAAELDRIVAGDGVVVLATPQVEHLAELRLPLGLLAVEEGKAAAVEAALAPAFTPVARTEVREMATVDRATAADLALMGPAGFHASAEQLAARAKALESTTAVTIAAEVRTLRRR